MKVNDVKDDLSQIGFDIESIQKMVAGLVSLSILLNVFMNCCQIIHLSLSFPCYQEGKIELLENKQVV